MSAAGRGGETGARPFPWAEAMAFGLGVLRLAPRDFWAMSPRELAGALQALRRRDGALPPPARSDLAELMRQFPDGGAQGL